MPGSVIVGGARTPIGKLSGALKGFVHLRGIGSTSPLLRIADRRYLRAALPWLRIANDLTGEQEVATLALAGACTVPRLPRQHANPAGCNDRHRPAPPARCGHRLGDPVRSRGRIHRAESLTDPGRRRRKLPQVDPIGTLLADRRNLHHNVAQYLALPNVGLHRFHRGRGSSWPADPGLRGDCRTRRCSNGVVTPRWGYGVLAGAVAGSCVARLLFTSCAAVTVNPRASRQPCRPGIAAAQGGNG
jgi:hypothetical protein